MKYPVRLRFPVKIFPQHYSEGWLNGIRYEAPPSLVNEDGSQVVTLMMEFESEPTPEQIQNLQNEMDKLDYSTPDTYDASAIRYNS